MLQILKEFFESLMAPAGSQSPQARERTLQLATAVLLVEVMRVDGNTHAAQQVTIMTALRERFALPDDALAQLVEQARQTAETANDYYRFTSSMNEEFTQAQKIQVVEAMWQVAYADARLDENEISLIGKIADLLYVTQGEYIGAKMRAKEAAQLGSSQGA
ncbi:TerB family tellurite resistance protein [Rhodoferax sediminis]|uniref:TerB family tellurite resistance protein n=1 Tax=Rhodoferax sediminis TaxID=2509614 RepID=A0A515DD80_9BURK|nr:TerB family tellurite resistance protein [Rhodoferax sediminis]QDL38367.1 TerB family tellurite resistance protein [Rhodoferax sediminis]